jgi:hypothetical protein
MNFLPTNQVLPRAQPFSREISYVNGAGPPPVEFFDRTQDHLAQFVHARLGWDWSAEREEFTTPIYPLTQYAASMFIARNEPLGAGLALANMTTGWQGEEGVLKGSAASAIDPYFFEMRSNSWNIGTQDFLVTCKVYCVRRSVIEMVRNAGIWIGCGPQVGAGATAYPALVGGSDLVNWHAWAHPDGRDPLFFDTGIPFLTSEEMPDQTRRAWNTVQISRINGSLRFFINGALARLTGYDFVGKEGLRFTRALSDFRLLFKTNRSGPGSTSDGFYMDYFSRWAKR